MADPKILPPPAATLLDYAVYGWAAEQRMLASSGRPRLPERKVWLPFFATLLAMPGWRLTIGAYALRGMRAWEVDPSIAACAEPALIMANMRDRLTGLLAQKGWPRPIPPPPPPIPPAAAVATAPGTAETTKPPETTPPAGPGGGRHRRTRRPSPGIT
ncbi:hypothetical protein [Telmatospirillum sp.]|uniref:hypothetical protein n=1 Tax=Telmatospirillum sp. TaxID=2079197 RepID=UPI002843B7F3|nr:hypothetical protein [Telmatospirillum sp.]MDR3440578.1 hypothetical protein [Telmatospirillum sp.]